MRIMLDTNVLVSALLFPGEKMNRMFEDITIHHTMVLSSYVIEELHRVIELKFANKMDVIEDLLSRMSYELVYTPKNYKKLSAIIRDEKDFPVLYTAMIEDADICKVNTHKKHR